MREVCDLVLFRRERGASSIMEKKRINFLERTTRFILDTIEKERREK